MATQKNASAPELPEIPFADVHAWRDWLEMNHAESKGIWLKFFKKGSSVRSITYEEALNEALCYGWIDGQLRKGDAAYYLQRFTPRTKKSIWSKRNREKVLALEKAGRMKPSGMLQVELAKKDGRWEQAYDSPARMQVPQDFLEALSAHQQAKAFYDSLNRTNQYAIAWRLQTARTPATRAKRFQTILEMMARGEKFH